MSGLVVCKKTSMVRSILETLGPSLENPKCINVGIQRQRTPNYVPGKQMRGIIILVRVWKRLSSGIILLLEDRRDCPQTDQSLRSRLRRLQEEEGDLRTDEPTKLEDRADCGHCVAAGKHR